jgi:S-adenosylmethionine hydrolase
MTRASGLVTLLTDFGHSEPFVAVMKGVMLGIDAQLRFVDLTHDLSAHDVRTAAFWLPHAAHWFPRGTTHLCVVDPGVGTARAALVAECDGQFFVAPDNGLLTHVLRDGARVVSAPVAAGASRTFHGRDVFAPLAAKVASGVELADLGLAVSVYERLAGPAVPTSAGDPRAGQIVVVDHFGNLISDVSVPAGATTRGWVRLGSGLRLPLVSSYQEGNRGVAAIVNSWGVIEVFLDRGRASDRLGVGVGTRVSFEPER